MNENSKRNCFGQCGLDIWTFHRKPLAETSLATFEARDVAPLKSESDIDAGSNMELEVRMQGSIISEALSKHPDLCALTCP